MSLLFVGEGRLGNQVFQYAYLRKRHPGRRITSLNLGALGRVFEADALLHVPAVHKNTEKVWRRIVVPVLLRPLCKWLRLGGYLSERVAMINGARSQSGEPEERGGLLPFILAEGGYYQNLSGLLSPADLRVLRLRADVAAQAEAVVRQAIGTGARPHIVMHVRRGDYVGFKTYGLDDVLLPISYYEHAVRVARDEFGAQTPVLIVSDDKAWCERELKHLQPFVVVSGSEAVDFALLAMFPCAILSNSTFSLAAACVGPHVQRVIGPQYWFGHRVRQWLPPHIRSDDPRFLYV